MLPYELMLSQPGIYADLLGGFLGVSGGSLLARFEAAPVENARGDRSHVAYLDFKKRLFLRRAPHAIDRAGAAIFGMVPYSRRHIDRRMDDLKGHFARKFAPGNLALRRGFWRDVMGLISPSSAISSPAIPERAPTRPKAEAQGAGLPIRRPPIGIDQDAVREAFHRSHGSRISAPRQRRTTHGISQTCQYRHSCFQRAQPNSRCIGSVVARNIRTSRSAFRTTPRRMEPMRWWRGWLASTRIFAPCASKRTSRGQCQFRRRVAHGIGRIFHVARCRRPHSPNLHREDGRAARDVTRRLLWRTARLVVSMTRASLSVRRGTAGAFNPNKNGPLRQAMHTLTPFKALREKKLNLYIYGLYRKSILDQIMEQPECPVDAGDRVLPALAALSGGLRYVDEPLFAKHVHQQSYEER